MAQLDEKQLRKIKRALIKAKVTEDEADRFLEYLKSVPDEEDEEPKEEPTTEEQVDEAKEDVAEKGEDEQSEQDRVDESVGEQEELDGNEDSQDAKDRVDESEGEKKAEDDKPVEEEQAEEEVRKEHDEESAKVLEAFAARLDALEEKFARFAEKLDDKPFGATPQGEPAEDDGLASEDAIMRSYNPAYRR